MGSRENRNDRNRPIGDGRGNTGFCLLPRRCTPWLSVATRTPCSAVPQHAERICAQAHRMLWNSGTWGPSSNGKPGCASPRQEAKSGVAATVPYGSIPVISVFSRPHARQGSFQILKRLFADKADTIPHMTPTGLCCPNASPVSRMQKSEGHIPNTDQCIFAVLPQSLRCCSPKMLRLIFRLGAQSGGYCAAFIHQSFEQG